MINVDTVKVNAIGIRAVSLFGGSRPAHDQLVHPQSIVLHLHFGLVGDSFFFSWPGHPQDNFFLKPVVVILEKLYISLELLDVGSVSLILVLDLAQFMLQQFVLLFEHVLPNMRAVGIYKFGWLFINGPGVVVVALLVLGLRVG